MDIYFVFLIDLQSIVLTNKWYSKSKSLYTVSAIVLESNIGLILGSDEALGPWSVGFLLFVLLLLQGRG